MKKIFSVLVKYQSINVNKAVSAIESETAAPASR
jgi:hypothetical protein